MALQGDKEQARGAYDSFLSLWREADSTSPLLRDVRLERGRLH
jgi:hypothetical protein